jgi:aspartate aminotransferase-like enzyme
LNDIDLLAQEAREADNTGTIATDDRFDNYRKVEREKQERRQVVAAQGLKKNKKEIF